MSKIFKIRRGTRAEVDAFPIPLSELIHAYDTDEVFIGGNSANIKLKTVFDKSINLGDVKGLDLTGNTDMTTLIQEVIDNNDVALVFPKGVYKLQNLIFKDNSVVYFEGCKFQRALGYEGRFIQSGENSILLGKLEIDGRKSLYSVETNTQSGLVIQEGSKFYGYVEVYDAVSHGIYIESNCYLQECNVHGNGLNPNPDGSSKGDGLYMVNGFDIVVDMVKAYNNSRNGVSVTTYDSGTEGLDPSLMDNVIINNIDAYSNTYIDTDIEGANNTIVNRVTGWGQLNCSYSTNCKFKELELKGFYAENHNDARVENVKIKPLGDVSNVFYLNGLNPYVDGVHIYDTADSYTTNTFTTQDLVNNNAIVKNVKVEKGYNALVVNGCKIFKNGYVNVGVNRYISVDARRISNVINQELFEVYGGLARIVYDYAPGSGFGLDGSTFKVGDIVDRLTPVAGGYKGWICTVAGTEGTWKQYGAIEA